MFWYHEDVLKREVHTKAVVIHRRAAGEGSVRVMLYTEELGLVTCIATSAREERSKLRAHLVAGTVGVYSLVKGKRDWRVMGAVRTINSMYVCVSDHERASIARILSMIRQFIHGEGRDADLYTALNEYVLTVPTLNDEDVVVAEYVAALNILAALGYVAPEPVRSFLGAQYSAALLTAASKKRYALVRAINDGISISGL